MRPESVSPHSWHSPSNAHAYRLYLVKELRHFALLTFVQRRDGIMRCFAFPCQALGFCPSPQSRAAQLLPSDAFANCEAYNYNIISCAGGATQRRRAISCTRRKARLGAMRSEGGFCGCVRHVGRENLGQRSAQLARVRPKYRLLDRRDLARVHREAAQTHRQE